MARFQVNIRGEWKDFAADEDRVVKRLYQQGGLARVTLRGQQYEYNFTAMEERNLSTRKVRAIRPPKEWAGTAPRHDGISLTIVGARGLRAADWFLGHGTSDPYCTCEVSGRGRSSLQTMTDAIKKTLNPVWNHKAELPGVAAGDSLVFKLYDKDWGKKDDFLGTVTLRSEQFLPSGFDGEVRVDEAGKGIEAYLKLKIAVLEEAPSSAPPCAEPATPVAAGDLAEGGPRPAPAVAGEPSAAAAGPGRPPCLGAALPEVALGTIPGRSGGASAAAAAPARASAGPAAAPTPLPTFGGEPPAASAAGDARGASPEVPACTTRSPPLPPPPQPPTTSWRAAAAVPEIGEALPEVPLDTVPRPRPQAARTLGSIAGKVPSEVPGSAFAAPAAPAAGTPAEQAPVAVAHGRRTPSLEDIDDDALFELESELAPAETLKLASSLRPQAGPQVGGPGAKLMMSSVPCMWQGLETLEEELSAAATLSAVQHCRSGGA